MGNVSLADLSPSAQAQAGEQIRAQQKPSKYKNKRAMADGIWFHSEREARRYCELKFLEKTGVISDLKLQPSFDLEVNGFRICRYIADFQYSCGPQQITEDVKGVRTREYILKAKLMKALYGIDIVEVK